MKKLFIPLLVFLFLTTVTSVSAIEKTENLCYKSPPDWTCTTNPTYPSAGGKVTYEDVDSMLQITVELWGLAPNTEYQLSLNGRCGGDGNKKIGNNCPKPNSPATWYGFNTAWECGFWSKDCNGVECQEGFWNFDMKAKTDANGHFRKTYHLNLPIGHYGPAESGCTPSPCCEWPIGFLVKEGGDAGPWNAVLMDENGLEFTIVGKSEKMTKIWNGLNFLRRHLKIQGKWLWEWLWISEEGYEGWIWDKVFWMQGKIAEFDNIFFWMRQWGGFADFWRWFDMPECEYECCVDDGVHKNKPCPEGEVCIDHTCVLWVCDDGDRQCVGDELQECQNNAWVTIETCEWGCSNGACNPRMTGWQCYRECKYNHRYIQACFDTYKWMKYYEKYCPPIA